MNRISKKSLMAPIKDDVLTGESYNSQKKAYPSKMASNAIPRS